MDDPLRALFIPQSRPEMGLGHITRCAALAEAMRDALGAQTVFALGDAPGAQGLAAQLDIETITLPQLGIRGGFCSGAIEAAGRGWDAVVVDCYDATEELFRELRDVAPRSICIDDLNALSSYVSDMLVNGNAYASELDYHAGPDTALVIGPRYAVTRSEFREARALPRASSSDRPGILVTMGGSDVDNLVLRAARCSDTLEIDFDAVLGAGAGYRHLAELERFVDGRPRFRIEQTPPKMSKLMLRADIAVTAGGSTCYETACMGLPSIAVAVADNQRPLTSKLNEFGVLICIGAPDAVERKLAPEVAALLDDPKRRTNMGRRGRELIDGWGALRIARRIGTLCGQSCRCIVDD